jgi:hypothetical protein
MVAEDLTYLLGIFLFLIGGVALAGVSLLVVEGVYRLYCKVRGLDY